MNLSIGNKCGKWTLIKEFKHTSYNHDTRFECKCDCGKIQIVRRYCLTRKRSTQCRSCARTKHGMYKESIYIIWCGIIQRCNNPNNKHYNYYGGRDIKVCERWLLFNNFLEDMGNRPKNKEIDRIDNNGDYTKENCRWVTRVANINNRRCSQKNRNSIENRNKN